VELPSWVPDDEYKPAPMPLLLVQSFVNTRYVGEAVDLLADAVTATPWVRDTELIGPTSNVTAQELEMARAFRESLRAVIAHNAGGPALTDAELRPLRQLAHGHPAAVSIGADGRVDVGTEPGGCLADGLVRLLLIVRDAQLQGTWGRLKTCDNTECRWAYYDRSHSRRGAWCDMATCGNRIKNRNLRARRRDQATGT
jgi:predicted RNA-binding Zn ribbon-like protein